MRHIILFPICFIFLTAGKAQSQFSTSGNEYTFLFYNTENFFDSENDSLTNDDEFTSSGDRRWNLTRFHDKADRLAKVILASGKWNAPAVVGLCEVENLNALEWLTNKTALSKFRYKIIQKDSPDERGIDVAMIYRLDLFRPFDYEAIPLSDPTDLSFRTRDILRVSGVIGECDTVHVFVNHWPSRYGGIMETLKYRKFAAQTLRKAILKLKSASPKAKIICMGDFNDTPRDESLAKVLEAKETGMPEVDGEMINLSAKWILLPVQTIKSQQTWETFDQLIISDSFMKDESCLRIASAEIFKPDFLLEPDAKFGGVRPKRTYIGFKYQEGFSDHLPVLLRMQIANH
jgi:hypothetical protein